MQQKKRLAFEVVKILWGSEKAEKARDHFETTFQKKSPKYEREIAFSKTLSEAVIQIVDSKSEAKRLIYQGAVDVNGITIKDINHKLNVKDKIKIGKFVIKFKAKKIRVKKKK